MASSKILFLNSFLERRKNNKKGSSNNNNNNNNKKDDLDLVKAAAWAWYEHGSGSEGNNKGLMNEFDITTTRTTHHQRTSTRPPSRYKLEAMKTMELNEEEKEEEENNIKSHRKKRNSLLFDAYKVQSISKQIDSHIVIESNKNKNTSSSSSSLMMKKKNKKETTKGFWLRHGAVCGSGEDVVDPATSAMKGGRRQASQP